LIYVLQNKITVTVYVPRGLWYDYYTFNSYFSIGKYYTFPAPIDKIPLLIRAGSILPAQDPGITTTESRKNNFELIVTLNETKNAIGELYWDDGDSLGKTYLVLNDCILNYILTVNYF